ncbi:MAG: NADH-quinone oxidoreductase subunit NuoE [Bacteroides sp.]|jgi:NADH:ubiquinone oxidoreductase subunit E|nr:NADH-quinone oxidoreductase subunit NuoE [Bacteroides sp.]
MTKIQEFVKEQADVYGRRRNSLMPILQAVVQKERFLSEEAMVAIATELDLSTADVFGTASFYTFLDTVPRGKNIIRICKTITCHMKGKDAIIETLEDMLKIKLGETTSDGKFSLLPANCLGWCHKGPVMLVNDEVYPEITPEKAVEVVHEYLKKTK